MTGIGSIELLAILFIGAVVIGPKTMQSFVHTIGKLIRSLRKIIAELKADLLPEVEFSAFTDISNEIKSVVDESSVERGDL